LFQACGDCKLRAAKGITIIEQKDETQLTRKSMKKILLMIPFVLPYLASHGQIREEVVATSGGHGKHDDTSLEWTLGEPVIATLLYGGTLLSQGFHQSSIVVTVIKSLDDLPYTIEAYPNPTDDLLLIQLKNAEASDFKCLLYDMNGKILYQKELESDLTAINMKNYPAGLYLLRVMKREKQIKAFEIIKH
jgi:hypothetical protein